MIKTTHMHICDRREKRTWPAAFGDASELHADRHPALVVSGKGSSVVTFADLCGPCEVAVSNLLRRIMLAKDEEE